MITIVDYGMGNLFSIKKAFEKLGFKVLISSSGEKLKNADKLVLPGVGAYKDAMKNIANLGILDALIEFLQKGNPFLGICLGMQLLFDRSEEGGSRGLGVLHGVVRKFQGGIKIPQMGWNNIKIEKYTYLLKGIKDGAFFYFAHSFFVEPQDKEIIRATANYGISFPSVISKGNIQAVQFHPEKSGENGLKILENFATC